MPLCSGQGLPSVSRPGTFGACGVFAGVAFLFEVSVSLPREVWFEGWIASRASVVNILTGSQCIPDKENDCATNRKRRILGELP